MGSIGQGAENGTERREGPEREKASGRRAIVSGGR
jgi:hypothetical protein